MLITGPSGQQLLVNLAANEGEDAHKTCTEEEEENNGNRKNTHMEISANLTRHLGPELAASVNPCSGSRRSRTCE